jgi:hypothetical protein
MPDKEHDKDKEFDEFIKKPIDIDNSDYYSYFLSILNGEIFGTELPDKKYSIIEGILISILNELGKIKDEDWKIDSYIYFIPSIKVNRLLEENITNILNSVDMIEDDCEKRNIFYVIVDTYQEADLLEKYFTVLFHALEKINDEFERQFGFEYLMFLITKTRLVDENFADILNTIFKMDIDEVLRNAFSTLTSLLRETEVSEENFIEFLNSLDKLSVDNKLYAFPDIITTLKGSNLPEIQKLTKFSLIRAKFPNILKTICRLDDENDKRYNICHLLFSIRKTYFLEENFLAILDTIDTIKNTSYRKANLENVISAIKEENSFMEKVKLIKERFPGYSDELAKYL